MNSILIANLVAQNITEFSFVDDLKDAFSDWWLGEDANAANAMPKGHPHKVK